MPRRERLQRSTAIAAILVIAAAFCAAAQTQAGSNRAQLSGTVTSVNAGANQLSLKSDKGEDVSVATTDHPDSTHSRR